MPVNPDVVAKREALDSIKGRLRGVVGALDITVDGLKDDVPRIGGHMGPKMSDLHGAVVALMSSADEMLGLLEELDALREHAAGEIGIGMKKLTEAQVRGLIRKTLVEATTEMSDQDWYRAQLARLESAQMSLENFIETEENESIVMDEQMLKELHAASVTIQSYIDAYLPMIDDHAATEVPA